MDVIWSLVGHIVDLCGGKRPRIQIALPLYHVRDPFSEELWQMVKRHNEGRFRSAWIASLIHKVYGPRIVFEQSLSTSGSYRPRIVKTNFPKDLEAHIAPIVDRLPSAETSDQALKIVALRAHMSYAKVFRQLLDVCQASGIVFVATGTNDPRASYILTGIGLTTSERIAVRKAVSRLRGLVLVFF